MGHSETIVHLEKLLALPRDFSVAHLEQCLAELMEKSSDGNAVLLKLDGELALVQNHIQLISLHLKQKYLSNQANTSASIKDIFYTKQELANKYRVSVRTVTNWIIDGLESEEVGGIRRISQQALEKFRRSSKGKKFSWRSITRHEPR